MMFRRVLAKLQKITLDNLHDSKRYELQIEKIFNKLKNVKGVGALFDLTQEGVPFFSFGYDRRSLSVAISESIKNESFRYSVAQLRSIKVKNKKKERLVYNICPLDKIVIGALCSLLSEILFIFQNEKLFSYKKGVTSKNEVIDLANYIKRKRLTNSQKGMYFLQTDISSYSDEINVSESSPFWKKLGEYFTSLNIVPTEYQWYLIKGAVRPDYYGLDGALQTNIKGAPTGSAITTLLYNHYVNCIDNFLTYDPDIFYARYSDDIILCHDDPEVVKITHYYLETYLKTLSLKLSEKKTHRFYFSPAGNHPPESDWIGANRIDLLGYSLTAKGDYTVSSVRQRRFLQRIFARVRNTLSLMDKEDIETTGQILCQAINYYMTDTQMGKNLSIQGLKYSTDIVQLEHLDYCIARFIAESLTGIQGCKSFRQIPYKKLREDWNLKSLVQIRNESRRGCEI